jgi:L-ascorbate metabolism protein UlaG (beta-lactamase superfamily)
MFIFLAVLIALALSIFLFLKLARFGKLPEGESLERIKQSSNYKNGQFENVSDTPMFTNGASYLKLTKNFFFNKPKRGTPSKSLPNQKADLNSIKQTDDVLLWFGHSSYYMQIDGKRILVDPVLSGAASPISFTTPSFNGSDSYLASEFPEIDFLFLTHDHWDHLDYKTLLAIKPKVKKVITSLGVGSHLTRWGYKSPIIAETDWNDVSDLGEGFIVHTKTARHFSGRTFTRNQSLWSSFVLQTPSMKIYIGGDSGYDNHFKTIGEQFGPFDLVMLECGQYNAWWQNIHMMPEETVQAAIDLKAKRLFPVHWGKFQLAMHDWDEPIIRALTEATRLNQPLITPRIGEIVELKNLEQQFSNWWKE